MTSLRTFLAPALFSLLFAACDNQIKNHKPNQDTTQKSEFSLSSHQTVSALPTPLHAHVTSSEPRLKIFEQQSFQNKALIYHLKKVASLSHTLLFHQRHRHGLALKDFFERAFAEPTYLKYLLSEEAYQEFLIFGMKFLNNAGVYNAGANLKHVLQKVNAEQLKNLLQRYASNLSYKTSYEITHLLLDPTYEVRQRPQEGEPLEESGGNIYEKGITHAELDAARKDPTFKLDLNTRVVRGSNGKLQIEVQTTQTPGVVGKILTQVVAEIREAMPFCQTKHQRNQLEYLAQYYETGDIEKFRAASIEWIKDRDASVFDFTTSWQEVYEDHLGITASMENIIVFSDPQANEIAKKIASHAQGFENDMPYGPFKKTFPEDYSPPALIAPYFLELASLPTGGFNLPNFDDIRKDVGFKNIIRSPLNAKSNSSTEVSKQSFGEYLPFGKVDQVVENMDKIWLVHVLLHEIIGHGSGTYDESKYGPGEDPITSIGREIGSSMASALEEERADLTGLVFVNDERLIEAGLYKDQAEADKIRNLSYDWYFADFLVRFARARSWAGAHARGHLLFANYQLAKGAVAWVSKNPGEPMTDKNRVLQVVDYDKVQEVSGELLALLQEYKATKNLTGIKSLFEKYAPTQLAQESWAQALIKRSEGMKMHWASFEQPWDVVKEKDGTYKLVLLGDSSLTQTATNFRSLVN